MKKVQLLIFLIVFSSALYCNTISDNGLNSGSSISEVTVHGKEYARFISHLNVEAYWKKGSYINWETGDSISTKQVFWAINSGTHCSGFVSGVCALLDVPIPHPPFPSGVVESLYQASYGVEYPSLSATSDRHLATKQGKWLEQNAYPYDALSPSMLSGKQEWLSVNAYQAQSFANCGYFTVAVYESVNSRPGHIVIVVPFQAGKLISNGPYTSFEINGPYEAQAGKINTSYTTISVGFAQEKNAPIRWYGANSSNNLVKFYVYDKKIDWQSVVIPQEVK